jgi:hypothetical protein
MYAFQKKCLLLQCVIRRGAKEFYILPLFYASVYKVYYKTFKI